MMLQYPIGGGALVQEQPPPMPSLSSSSIQRRITFLRHGCTYMNEYLGGADGGKRFGSPGFTDVFESQQRRNKYHDSPLSEYGRRQTRNRLLSSPLVPRELVDIDLVVTSPLTRALQTYHMGVRPHLSSDLPVVATPLAAERLYLVSDVGRPWSTVQKEFPYVTFDYEGSNNNDKMNDTKAKGTNREDVEWWYHPNNSDQPYTEWRPTGQGQRYACPGEPPRVFDQRMSDLYHYLGSLSASNVLLVCHHGVIEWMLDMDFDNVQYKTVFYGDIQPRALQQLSAKK